MKKRGNKKVEERFFIKDKKAMEMSVNTLIVIVLAIFLLIGLLFIWNRQTGIFSDFLDNLFSRTNVDDIVTACNSLVARNSVYEYCCVEKEIRYKKAQESSLEKTSEKGMVKEEMKCRDLADKEIVGGRIGKINCENTC